MLLVGRSCFTRAGDRLLVRPWRGGGFFRIGRWSDGVPLEDAEGCPAFDLGLHLVCDALAREVPEVEWYVADIPDDVREPIESYCSSQPLLLHLLANWPGYRDLFASTPLLAWMLAVKIQDLIQRQETPPRTVALLKQRRIAELVGLPGDGERVVRLLRRIRVGDPAMRRHARVLVDLLRKPALVRGLAHLRSVSLDLLYYLASFPLLRANPELMLSFVREAEQLSEAEVEASVRLLHEFREDTLRFAEDDGCQAMVHRELDACRSLREVRRLHDRRQRMREKERERAWLEGPFPEPPIPGGGVVEPLDSARKVIDEGREMGHCVASYIPSIRDAEGDAYLFRLDAAGHERVTFLVTNIRTAPRIREAKLAANGYPSKKTMAFLEKWLANAVTKGGTRGAAARRPEIMSSGAVGAKV